MANILFSLFYDLYHVEQLRQVSLRQVINVMRGETLKDLTEQIRQTSLTGNLQAKSKLKSQLPIITACGIFNPRRSASLIKPSFVYQLDIDKAENPLSVLEKLKADQLLHVLIASLSVSGKGVKALLLIQNEFSEYGATEYRDLIREFHYKMADYFSVYYNCTIDGQMKNPSQPFFLFHSPDLWVNPIYQ